MYHLHITIIGRTFRHLHLQLQVAAKSIIIKGTKPGHHRVAQISTKDPIALTIVDATVNNLRLLDQTGAQLQRLYLIDLHLHQELKVEFDAARLREEATAT